MSYLFFSSCEIIYIPSYAHIASVISLYRCQKWKNMLHYIDDILNENDHYRKLHVFNVTYRTN